MRDHNRRDRPKVYQRNQSPSKYFPLKTTRDFNEAGHESWKRAAVPPRSPNFDPAGAILTPLYFLTSILPPTEKTTPSFSTFDK
jgi:hypothetical protein